VLGERDFQSLFQQSPGPPGGGLFYTQKIRIIDAAPAGLTHTVRAWDLSATASSFCFRLQSPREVPASSTKAQTYVGHLSH
jgi:hypothetical protein